MKCQTTNCHHDVIPGTDSCPRHTDEKQRVRRYRLNSKRLQERVSELTAVDHMASLEEEVALAQTMLEERLNACGNNQSEIISAHEATNRSLETISKLVQVMHKHDLATGEVLSKPALERLMGDILDDVSEELEIFEASPEYAGMIDRIEEKLTQRIQDATND